jgi:ADP-heptose:LPS heptosyltransferase
MLPNQALECGTRLEKWLPQYETNWRIFDDFVLTGEELAEADEFYRLHGKFAIFFMGSASGNSIEAGHNRNSLWTPYDWLSLGRTLKERYGLKIVVVGMDCDREYWAQRICPLLFEDVFFWFDRIGRWPDPGGLFAVIKKAAMVVSYQSGIGIVSHYLGVPTAIFWRPAGNSISSSDYVSFDERMAHAWAYPTWEQDGKLLPCIYGRHGVNYILTEAEKRGWVCT